MKGKFNLKTSWYPIILIMLIIIIVAVYRLLPFESTSDAYVEGNPILINALRDGFVTHIHTDDTFLVLKDQPLVELNRTDSLIHLNEAKDKLAEGIRHICKEYHHLFSLQSEVMMKRAERDKAKVNFKHRRDVISEQGVSLEDFQNAQDDYRAAEASLAMTEKKLAEVYAYLQGKTINNHPFVAQAKQHLIDAWVQLYRSTIYAPESGIVSNRHIQVSMTVGRNQPLMSVVPLDQIWVNANFKENQLKQVRIGQSARVTSDYYGRSVVYKGRIVGIGVAAGNVTSLLPPQNLSGNWIKIVQRLPVRIELEPEQLKKHPLRLGLSMHVTIYTSNQSGSRLPTDNKNAPQYQTSIFAKEKDGVKALIDKIVTDNLDPSLKQYAKRPLVITFNQPKEK